MFESLNNNGYNKHGEEVEKLISILPTKRQLEYQEMEYYNFIHFGMNTFLNVEWSDGTASPKIFNPKTLDTDQWACSLKASGSTGIILTAKHHDGFCLWPSQYTNYTIAQSPYKNGEGNIVKELSESCKKYDLKFGIYLSPWDRHERTYGTKAYNVYYMNQLRELLTGYGDIFCVWLDGAKGEDAPDFEYDFNSYFELIRELQPKTVISICGPDVRWIGNENGVERESEWSVVSNNKDYNLNSQNSEDTSKLMIISDVDRDLGSREVLSSFKKEQLVWYPAETDVSIRRRLFNQYGGWFYHKNQRNKTLSKLVDIYLRSIGGNSSLLLNVPVTTLGLIDNKTKTLLSEFGKEINSMFEVSLVSKLSIGDKENQITTSEINKLLEDKNWDSYELLEDDYIVELELNNAAKYLVIREDLRYSQRVEKFELFAYMNGWKLAGVYTTIGNRKIIKIDKQFNTAKKLRIVFVQTRSTPVLRYINAF